MDRKKILWVRLDAIGDTILAGSMLEHIYERFGRASITVVCDEHTAELYEACPFVDKVIGAAKMRLFFDSNYRNSIVQALQAEHFDLALDTTCSWSQLSDLFLVGSMAREKVAFENLGAMSGDMIEKRRKVFTRLVKFRIPFEPEMERYRDFLSDLGIEVSGLNASIWTKPEDDEQADRIFEGHGLVPEKTIALFAFARSHLRTYPFYGEAIGKVCADHGFSVVALGDGAAYGFNEACLGNVEVPSVNLSGKLTLRQTAAVLRKCRLAVGAETGLAHMACAVGIPNVIVIGGGHMGRFMPTTPRTSLVALPLECFNCDWSCRYKRAHCVADIAPEVVEYAMRETLGSDSDLPRLFLQSESRWHPDKTMPSWQMVGKFIKHEKVKVIQVEFDDGRDFDARLLANAASKLIGYSPQAKPHPVEAALREAMSLREKGKIEQAIELLNRAIEENSQFPDLMNLKAELYLQSRKIEEAKEILWKTINSFPFNVPALNNIAVIEIMQNRLESALGVLQRLLDIEPKNETALSNLRFIENELALKSRLLEAEQAILANDLPAARAKLNEILAVNPTYEDALTGLAVVEAREGKHDEALRILQRVIGANPANEYALQLMEKLLLKN